MDFQREYNPDNKLFNMESEILLPKNKVYTDITDTGKYDAEKRNMAETLYNLAFKDTEISVDDLLSRIRVWE